jgi:hypothetical protein
MYLCMYVCMYVYKREENNRECIRGGELNVFVLCVWFGVVPRFNQILLFVY